MRQSCSSIDARHELSRVSKASILNWLRTQTSKMADNDHEICETLEAEPAETENTELPAAPAQICLGCGGEAVVRKRSVLSGRACAELLPFVKIMLSKRLSDSDTAYTPEGLDGVLKVSYLCKACSVSYKKVVGLYNSTEKSLSYVISQLHHDSVDHDDDDDGASVVCIGSQRKRPTVCTPVCVVKKRRVSPSVKVYSTVYIHVHV